MSLSVEQFEAIEKVGIDSLEDKYVSITGIFMDKEDGTTSGFIENIEQICLLHVRE